MDKRFNLYTKNPEEVMDQVPNFNYNGYHLFPNFPMVYLTVKPWLYQESPFWIVTKDLPSKVYTQLRKKNLAPLYGANYTHDNMEHMYYKQHCYQYA